MYKLYGYWRSSASWRVRWALALKKIDFEYVPVNLLKAEQKSPEHLVRSPGGVVPVLEVDQGVFLNQSVAILFYLDQKYPNRYNLMGETLEEKVYILSLCELINSDTASLQTPRVQKRHSEDPAEQVQWAQHFIREGFRAYARAVGKLQSHFSVGNTVKAPDLFLVPQIYNAIRYGLDVSSEFPRLYEIYSQAMKSEAAMLSHPEKQSDAVLT